MWKDLLFECGILSEQMVLLVQLFALIVRGVITTIGGHQGIRDAG